MSWEWDVLAALVRFLFLLAPFMDVAKDFHLGDALDEAKEFALAGSCRAMLISFPAQFLLAIFARASNEHCQTVSLLLVVIYVIAALLVGFGLFKIHSRRFRGTVRPFIWLAAFEGLSVLVHIVGLGPAVRGICRQ